MTTKISSIDKTLLKIVYQFNLDAESNLNLSWETFVSVMSSGEDPVYESIRTIREKWQILHAAGYLLKTNQYSSRFNSPKVFGEVIPRIRGEGQ